MAILILFPILSPSCFYFPYLVHRVFIEQMKNKETPKKILFFTEMLKFCGINTKVDTSLLKMLLENEATNN